LFAQLLCLRNKNTFYIPETETHANIHYGLNNIEQNLVHQRNGIFWHGGNYSLPALYDLKNVLVDFSKGKQITLYIVSGNQVSRMESWSDLKVVYLPWSTDNLRYAASYSRIGIVPARHGLRSNFLKPASRLRLMYALGVPSIGDSRVPDVRKFAAAFGGPMAGSACEWRDRITDLWQSNSLASTALNGWSNVSEFSNTSVAVRQWIAYFSQRLFEKES
jgi:hypothetical protein